MKWATRRFQRTQTPRRLWPLTLWCDLDLSSRSRKMLLIVFYLGTRYDVYGFNTLRNITICLFYVTFDLHLWPWAYVKVTFTSISRCTLCNCTLVPSIKLVGKIEFEIWTIVYRKLKWRHNDIIIHSSVIKSKTQID